MGKQPLNSPNNQGTNPFAAPPADPAAPAADDEPPDIPFTPVPRLRVRRDGWTPQRQWMFIAALAGCGSVTRAARAVGMTPRSAYRLADADGADDFAAAWDVAIETGIERVRLAALERAINGVPVALFRRGKLVRIEQRSNDRLAIALLAGRDRCIDDFRRSATARRKYWADMRALDAARAEEKRAAEAIRAEHQAILDAIAARGGRALPTAPPRIRRL